MDNTHLGNGILGAAEAPALAEGSRDTALDPTPVSTGQNRPVDDGQRVVNLPPEQLQAMRRPGAPKSKKRKVWIPIKDDIYEGYEFYAWVNYPKGFELELSSGEDDRQFEVLRQIVLDTNNWEDYNGVPYPHPSERDFWTGERSIPNELLGLIMTSVRLESANSPNLLIETWKNTKRI